MKVPDSQANHDWLSLSLIQESDYLKSGLSLAIAGFSSLGSVLGCLKPHLFLLGAFGAFVIWNQGVVLGISPVFRQQVKVLTGSR